MNESIDVWSPGFSRCDVALKAVRTISASAANLALCRIKLKPGLRMKHSCFMKYLVIALLVILSPSPVPAGTITGTVRAQGKPGADADAQCGKYDSRQFKFVERVNYAEMHDFVVYIEGPVGAKPKPPEKPAQVVTSRVLQKGAMFSPHVLPILVGTTVEWPNHDEILHNVFSRSESNPFDLGLYKNPNVERWTFDKTGRVDVFCSIHTRMSCIVLVLENPYFAASNEKGAYIIADVPAGAYKLKAWHERLPSQTRDITVPDAGQVKADFTLGIFNLPKP
jgi:plastocyanin